MWFSGTADGLMGGLVPDHKTIADFCNDNGEAICKMCARLSWFAALWICLATSPGIFGETRVNVHFKSALRRVLARLPQPLP
jgi:hypothetical protein